MSFFKKRSKSSNHARDRVEPRRKVNPSTVGDSPKLRRATVYQITDTENGKSLKWTVHGEHVVTLKDLVFEGEVTLTYRVLPKVVEALQGLIREQEASGE